MNEQSFAFFDGGVTSPKGFLAAGVHAGIKKEGLDMAMLYCEVPCTLAGTFTSNLVKAAPVKWDQRIVKEVKSAQAVVVNSGIANAATGAEGMACCEKTAEAVSAALGIAPDHVLTASTGVIGKQLPMEKIEGGVKDLAASLKADRESAVLAATAIMTTDTVRKEAAVKLTLGGREVTLAGMTKGSGMIHPNMCTMLAFLTTDAAISSKLMQKALSECAGDSFNMITVDGDTSTNDTCLLMASHLAGNPLIEDEGEDYQLFKEALKELTVTLAKKMAKDGEGAEALFEVIVEEAADKESAAKMARTVAGSNLVKTAIAGHDANWGRILCAMGYSGAFFEEEKVDLYFESRAGKIMIAKGGVSTGYSEDEATKILSEDEVTARIVLHMGEGSAAAWGCDLTHEYITINADYRS